MSLKTQGSKHFGTQALWNYAPLVLWYSLLTQNDL